MGVVYAREQDLAADEYSELLRVSGMAERRPVDDPERMAAAIRGSDLVVTARVDGVLVGAARAITDYYLHCYIGDLAVHPDHQRRGIGLGLQQYLRDLLDPGCKIKLSATPNAAEYYPRLGYSKTDRSWELPPGSPLG